MPARAKGPRLWLRPEQVHAADGVRRQAVWLVRDGRHTHSTGCGPDDLAGAGRALERYLAEKHARAALSPAGPEGHPGRAGRGRDPHHVPIADTITLYWQGRGRRTARPEETRARLLVLNEFWGDRTVDDVTDHACAAYAEARAPTAAAARRELEDLRAAIRYAFRQRLLTREVPVALPPRPMPRQDWLTRDEMARLLWAAWRGREHQRGIATGRHPRRHVARFVLIARYTGTRAGAICAASIGPTPEPGRGWIDLDEGIYYRKPRGARETAKRRPTIRLPAPLLAHLRRWHRHGNARRAAVEYNGAPIARLSKAFRGAVALAGLPDTITPHTLRHTSITWTMQAGADPVAAAAYFGVSTEVMQSTYLHHHPDFQSSVHAALARGGRTHTGRTQLRGSETGTLAPASLQKRQ